MRELFGRHLQRLVPLTSRKLHWEIVLELQVGNAVLVSFVCLTRQGSAARRPTNDRPDHDTLVAVAAATRVSHNTVQLG